MTETDKYQVINYFDVYESEDGWWQINKQCNEGFITLQDYTSEAEIVQKLIEMGFFTSDVSPSQLSFENDYEMIEIKAEENGSPICRLELIQ